MNDDAASEVDAASNDRPDLLDAGQTDSVLPSCGCFNGDGVYCGQGVVDFGKTHECRTPFAEAHSDDLLRCTDRTYAIETSCKAGCRVMPGGQADMCKVDGTTGYLLPWTCGLSLSCTQGNHGDICGSHAGDHTGVQEYAWDFGLPRHTAVLATRAGRVTVAANVTKPGQACYDGCTQTFNTPSFWNCCNQCINISNHVNIDHGDGTVSTYFHLDVVTATVGELVQQGSVIGYSGTSGCSSGPHLHFQVMGDCPTGYCQSIAVQFADAKTPACGDRVTSQNGCQ
jgi:hypothetical protein